MSRSSAFITLGVLVVIAPLSGLPQSWITFLLAIIGIIIVLMGISMRSEAARRQRDMAYVPPTLPTAPAAEPESPHEHHSHHAPSAMS